MYCLYRSVSGSKNQCSLGTAHAGLMVDGIMESMYHVDISVSVVEATIQYNISVTTATKPLHRPPMPRGYAAADVLQCTGECDIHSDPFRYNSF